MQFSLEYVLPRNDHRVIRCQEEIVPIPEHILASLFLFCANVVNIAFDVDVTVGKQIVLFELEA